MIMVYITIPSMASFDEAVKLEDGSLDPEHLGMKKLMERYTVQEVSPGEFEIPDPLSLPHNCSPSSSCSVVSHS